jgi:S-adenosylmethionine synthetase
MHSRKLFAAESATCGQPDKLCDLIVDTILDRVLAMDRFARVDLDAMAAPGMLFLAGQLSTKAYVGLEAIIRQVVRDVGYAGPDVNFNADSIAVLHVIGEQSHEVAAAVDNKGAGNQCVCVGYASGEGKRIGVDLDFMPLPQWLAHKLAMQLESVRKAGELPQILPDGTAQVVVHYENDLPTRVSSAGVCAHHKKSASIDEVRDILMVKVIDPVLNLLPDSMTQHTEKSANNAAAFTIGGPAADIGLSGRKSVSDTYGTACAFGGSSPVGKDPTKTDRAALYMARYLAKNLVAAGVAERIELRLIYSFGRRDPISVQVESFGTADISEMDISIALQKLVDLSSPGVVEHLRLRENTYAPLACGGFFGRTELASPWERLDLVDEIKKALA